MLDSLRVFSGFLLVLHSRQHILNGDAMIEYHLKPSIEILNTTLSVMFFSILVLYYFVAIKLSGTLVYDVPTLFLAKTSHREHLVVNMRTVPKNARSHLVGNSDMKEEKSNCDRQKGKEK